MTRIREEEDYLRQDRGHAGSAVCLSVICSVIYLRQRRRYMFLPVFVCLSVCLLARLLKNTCMDLDEMLHVDRRRDMDELINF